MANNVGDINVRVTADVGQFRASMRMVVESFKRGEITAKQYAHAVAGIAAQANGFQVQSSKAAVSIGRLRGSFTALATSMLGIRGPLGSVVSTLSMLALGSGVATGIVAGIAAVTFGIQQLGNRAKEAADRAGGLMSRLRTMAADAAKGFTPAAPTVGELRTQMNQFTFWSGALGKSDPAAAREFATAALALAQQINKLNEESTEAAQKAREEALAQQEKAAALMATAEGYRQARVAAGALRAGALGQTAGFGRPLNFFGYRDRPAGLGSPLGFTAGAPQAQTVVNQSAEYQRTIGQLRAETQMSFTEIGQNGAVSLVRGFAGALKGDQFNLGSLLRNVFGSLIEDVVVQAIVNALRKAMMKKALASLIPGVGALGFLPGFAEGGVVPGRSGQAQLAVVHGGETVMPTRGGAGVFQVAVPQLAGPALITNAEWQRIWRDTAREATRQGFRMAVI